MEENKEVGVKEMLTEIKTKLEAQEKPEETKKWKMPWKGKVSTSQARNNYATICVVKDNLEVDFVKKQISDGTIDIDGLPRVATADHVLHYKGKPFFIVPYWDTKPFSPVSSYEQSVRDRTNIAGRRLILSKLEKEAIKPKGKMNNTTLWIILGVIILGAGYYFIKGGF